MRPALVVQQLLLIGLLCQPIRDLNLLSLNLEVLMSTTQYAFTNSPEPAERIVDAGDGIDHRVTLFKEPKGNQDSDDDDGNETNPIQITAMYMDGKAVVVRQYKRLMISCVFNSDEIADISDLQWRREGGHAIDESSSPSLFTVGLKEHRTGHRKRNLHFTAVHKRDEGTYICSGKDLDGKVFERQVVVEILDEIDWNDASTVAGALEGEPLTIDCGVKSKSGSQPQIEITAGDGEALDPDEFTIAGHEVTISQLSPEYNKKVISCVHVEISNGDRDFPVVDRKDVEINVWGKPEFDDVSKEQFTILSGHHKPQHVTLFCNVTDSNPPATHYVFYRGSEELTDPVKYSVVKHIGKKQGAELKIHFVNQDDLAEYRCEVNNGKAKASQIIHLREASPPREPKVTLEDIHKHSLKWKIESSEDDDELPIIDVSIEYLRKAILDEQDVDEDDDEAVNAIWEKRASKLMRPKSKNSIYEVPGLRKGSEYIFKFRHVSQAGAGEPFTLTAFTEDDESDDNVKSSSSLSLIFSLLVLAPFV